jgi:glutamate-5-semialdehyde dehydrogenase
MSLALVTDEAAEAERIELMPMLTELGRRARAAQRVVGLASAEQKTAGLRSVAAAIRATKDDILSANAVDLAAANTRGQTAAFLDRLMLTVAGVESIAQAVEDIAALPDPVGRVLASFTRPNGLVIERVATPLGVIGVIFESRPNVTADAGALCLKAGNATILRAGSDSFESAMAIRGA